MRKLWSDAVVTVLILTAFSSASLRAATIPGNLIFTNNPLLLAGGNSEPEISIGQNGTMGIVALSTATPLPKNTGTDLWIGTFGSVPVYQGIIDNSLQQTGKQVFGGADTDIDIGATGALHITSLLTLFNATSSKFQVGVSAITCPNAAAGFDSGACTSQIIDTAGTDRPWNTSDNARVWIAYHDSRDSSLVHVQRSDDDGLTWNRVGDPVVGQGPATGNATFNNINGPIVADRFTHNLYDIYAAGEVGLLKAKTIDFDRIFVSRSTDGGKSWTATLVFHSPTLTSFHNVFPTLAVDPSNGKLYAAWSDGHIISFSASSDEGGTWSAPVAVNAAPANSCVMPWIAAHNGTVDLVYYATDASSKDDPSAVWNVYVAQTNNDGSSFTQSRVSNTPNHVGVICTAGDACDPSTRTLLDLFQVTIDPSTGRAGVIYTDDMITKDSSGNPVPQVVLAQQK
jgi:hypothetical protein